MVPPSNALRICNLRMFSCWEKVRSYNLWYKVREKKSKRERDRKQGNRKRSEIQNPRRSLIRNEIFVQFLPSFEISWASIIPNMVEPPNGVRQQWKHYYSMWQMLFEIDTKYAPIKPIGRGAYGAPPSTMRKLPSGRSTMSLRTALMRLECWGS
ncbi:hypothetical protein CIPAW_08G174500 [Carya illinoinensis]|uniref:Uncharacterized protein n=1 Tax=Carya illinoinensis TaxID=32201 RepID=A0A8T1PWI4_CARIL|nr:hypothetical protein CIPAW_08G174500 [Carya illinoinensis]